MERRRIRVEGVVQGVGFRPYVHRLARRHDLRGLVRNQGGRVEVEVEGDPSAVEGFLRELPELAPPLARVDRVRSTVIPVQGASRFSIEPSDGGDPPRPVLPPDAATCPECLAELRDPADRRHRYPFLNCTHCGPRYTVVHALPYDRERTTMRDFRFCSHCQAEYEDPADRRFHAQPVACPACGPSLQLIDRTGAPAEGAGDPVTAAAAILRSGGVVAVKGIGGYHLACDAGSEATVRRLRTTKGRVAKPLAVMVRDLEAAERLAAVPAVAREALASTARPIVLVPRRPAAALAPSVAPGLEDVGLMLPYTPLHHLLMEAVPGALVLTSGNRTGEPILTDDREARERLGPVVDVLLTHDRPIAVRCDDSVARVLDEGVTLLRRSRGYVPALVRLPVATPRPLLAVGGHLKNTFCLARQDEAAPSHHVGDLDGREAWQAFRRDVTQLENLLGVVPEVVVHDVHPAYLSTRYALERAEEEGLATLAVQHHHAHVASLLAEHGEAGPVIGVAFDGTGYGEDGAVWGGELLVGDLEECRRIAHLAYTPLPGGEAAVREPWRMAAAHLWSAGLDPAPVPGLLEGERAETWALLRQAMEHGIASPTTSSVGRLFDAAAALLGLRHVNRFEGEAAMVLESVADPSETRTWPVKWEEDGPVRRWSGARILQNLLDDFRRGRSVAHLSAVFHGTVCRAVVEGCRRIREEGGPEVVALTGGVFQNGLLLGRTRRALTASGFRVLVHRRVPPNDGGLAVGQASVAAARLARSGRAAPPRPRDVRPPLATGSSIDPTRTSPSNPPLEPH